MENMEAFPLIPNPVSIPGVPFLAQVFHTRNMFLTKTILLLEKVQNKILVSPGAFLFIGSILIIIGVATISVGSFVNEVTGGGPILWCIGGFCILLGIINIIQFKKKRR